MRIWSFAASLTLITACGIPDGDGEPADGTEGESSSGAVSTTTEPPPDPSVTSSTTVGPDPITTTDGGDTTDADSDTTDGSDTTDDPPGSVCDPQPMSRSTFALRFDHDPEDPFPDQTIELDVACTVADVSAASGVLTIELSCEDAPHVLDVSDLGPIDLSVGDAVTLRIFDVQPWWRETYIALLRDGEVIVAGLRSSSLPWGDGNDFTPPATFFAPLQVAVVDDVCRPEPLPEVDEPCNFICADPCYQVERQALELHSGGESIVIHDGNEGTLDGLQIFVGTAEQWLNVQCTDTPGSWRDLVVVRTL